MGLHDELSQRVFLPALRIQQFLRQSRRAAALARWNALRFRTISSQWDDDRKREWMLQQLRRTIRYAANTTTYYSQLFARVGFDPAADFSFQDFGRLPALEKDDIHNRGRDLLSSAVAASQRMPMATGGSTGKPVEVYVGPEDQGWGAAGVEVQRFSLGVPLGCRTAQLWGHTLDPIAANGFVDRFTTFINNVRWFDSFRLSHEYLEQVHFSLECYQPHCVLAYASALGALAEHVLERGHRPSYPLRCFITGAEKLDVRHRQAVLAAFGRNVHEQYGSRDIGLMAWQQNPNRSLSFRVNWENVLIEPETEGRESAILVTKLHADAMPMIRYRIGDVARFPVNISPGNPAFVLDDILGRVTDRVLLRDGRSVHGSLFPHLFKDFPVGEFMVIQQKDFSVDIDLVPKPNFCAAHEAQLRCVLSKNLPGVPFTVRRVVSIARGAANKWRPVVSHAAARS